MNRRKIDSNAITCYIGAISAALLIITTLMTPSLQDNPIAILLYAVIAISLIFIIIAFINNSSECHPIAQCNKTPIYDDNSLRAILGLTEVDLKRLRDKGLIGYSHYGNKYWYTQSDLDRFLSRCHNEPFG